MDILACCILAMTSSNITLTPFKAEHIKHVRLYDEVNRGQIAEAAQYYESAGISFTALTPDGKIIACAGVIPFWVGVGSAWFGHSGLAIDYKLTGIKFIKSTLDEIMQNTGLWRVQAFVNADSEPDQKFSKLLGFTCESRMKKMRADKGDYLMYVKVI